jgi:MFS family permease
LLYIPTIWWLWKAPYGPRFRQGKPPPSRAIRGMGDIVGTLRQIAENRVLTSMIVLGGCASFFVGNAYQAQMPVFAHDLGHGDPGLSYGALLTADAMGALLAGLILESRNLLQVRARTALVLAMLWCCVLAGFALSHVYALSLAMLFVAGFVELSFNSMAQTLVQLNAPAGIRGRVIGVFSMAALGMRTFSGVTVGVVGGRIGVHASLATSALALLCVILGLLALSRSTRADT